MGSAPLRISRISENLRIIQSEISILANEELALRPPRCPLSDPDIRALRQMKRSIDQLRRVLRTYIEFADAKMGACESTSFSPRALSEQPGSFSMPARDSSFAKAVLPPFPLSLNS